MNGRTHLVLGISSSLAFNHIYGSPEYMLQFAVFGAVGGLIPDIDHPQSIITSFVPFSGLMRLFVGGHRGITHTLLFWAVILAAVFVAFPSGRLVLGAVGVGVVSHLIADMLTPRGVPLLAPISWFNFTLFPSGLLAFTAWIFEALATVGALAFIVCAVIGRLPK